jgi:hypothetical protein
MNRCCTIGVLNFASANSRKHLKGIKKEFYMYRSLNGEL